MGAPGAETTHADDATRMTTPSAAAGGEATAPPPAPTGEHRAAKGTREEKGCAHVDKTAVTALPQQPLAQLPFFDQQPLDPKTEALLDLIEKEAKEPLPPIDEALDMSALPSERGKKRMRPENVKNHFNSPMRKFTGAVLNFYVDKCETTLYDLQAMADLVWGRTLTLQEVLDIAIFGHSRRPSSWTFIERGFVQSDEWVYPYTDKLEQDVDASQHDILLLRPCPTTEKWGPVVAEYYGYTFQFNHDESPYYYLRLKDGKE